MRHTLLCIVILLVGLPFARPAESTPTPYTIAILRDQSAWADDLLCEKIRLSLHEMALGRLAITFTEQNLPDSDDLVLRHAIDDALAAPHINAILVLGTRLASVAADPALSLGKPTLGAVLVDPDLVQLPYDAQGHSTKPNFAVVAHSARSADLLRAMQNMVPFSTLQVLAGASDSARLADWQTTLESTLGATVKVILPAPSVTGTLDTLEPASRTVFVLPTSVQTASEYTALLDGLRNRHYAVLSFRGQPDVEAGALAGALPDSTVQLARRVAIVFDQLISGIPLDQISLHVSLRPELFFNETTAAEIDFIPSFAALHTATLVRTASQEAGNPISLADAVAIALEKNHALRARQAGTEASRQDVAGARGTLFPQVAALANYQHIDRDRAQASGGLFPERTLVAGVGLTQTIFDDEALTRIRQARTALKAANATEKVQRLNTAHTASLAYLNYLSARAALRIAEQNAAVTHKHLGLAHLRQRIGTSGPEDIYRFESLSAQQRAETVAARMQVERARTELNQVLGVAPDTLWSPHDTSLEDPEFAALTLPLTGVITNRKRFESLRAYLMDYATLHSPDLDAIEQGVSVQRLAAAQKQRRTYLPKIAASANLGRLIEQDYGGPTFSEQLNAVGLPVPLTDLDRTVWTVGVQASLPLFSGGSLTADQRKARAQLRQLELTRDEAREAIKARTQASLCSIESSYTNIELARISADLARQNLDLVQRKYEQGTVSIITLLDAQNAAFARKQAAEVAVYRFLSDVLVLERIIGWIEVLATPEENTTWLREARTAIDHD
jgi:outer membrane protein